MQGLNKDIYHRLIALKNEILSVVDFYDLKLFLKVSGTQIENLVSKPRYYSFDIP